MANKTSSFLDNSPPKVDQIWLNMVTGEVANAIPMAGDSVDATGLVNNQLTNAVKSYVSQAGILCTDTSSGANVYIINASTPFTNPVLKTGTRVRFKTANANTGSSTITAFGGSAITCKKSDGSTNLASGDITANSEVEFVYNGTNWVKTLYGAIATTTNQGVSYLTPNKNVIINGNFNINQRVVSGTVSLSSGVYGHDRWKAGASGCTYTFATTNNITTITISAGSLIQVVEGNNLVSDTYCLSWSGTAQGKIGAGSYGASGTTGSATGGTNLNIEFGTGTLSLVQLEKNLAPTPFEHRFFNQELSLCQRYYQKTFDYATAPANNAGVQGCLYVRSNSPTSNTNFGITWFFKVPMRSSPAITCYNPLAGNSKWRQIGSANEYDSTIEDIDENKALISYTGGLAPAYQKWGIQATATSEL